MKRRMILGKVAAGVGSTTLLLNSAPAEANNRMGLTIPSDGQGYLMVFVYWEKPESKELPKRVVGLGVMYDEAQKIDIYIPSQKSWQLLTTLKPEEDVSAGEGPYRYSGGRWTASMGLLFKPNVLTPEVTMEEVKTGVNY